MWYVGPEPILAGELEWIDLPSGGYRSSLTHGVNLAGQMLSAAKPDVRQVALLISDGTLSNPEEIVEAVLAKRFHNSVTCVAAPLTGKVNLEVLQMFAGDRVFDETIFPIPISSLPLLTRPFLRLSQHGLLPLPQH
ncbi:MAG: hypothetical protein LBU24_02765 [Methanocalculaceae archaeon]|jgi:hypothetical protein|nr:hypothetical protein [Methanocalculaceae archaeon]